MNKVPARLLYQERPPIVVKVPMSRGFNLRPFLEFIRGIFVTDEELPLDERLGSFEMNHNTTASETVLTTLESALLDGVCQDTKLNKIVDHRRSVKKS
jgi:hypothetical protein